MSRIALLFSLAMLTGCGPSLSQVMSGVSVGGISESTSSPTDNLFDPYHDDYFTNDSAKDARTDWDHQWIGVVGRESGDLEEIEWYSDGKKVVLVAAKPRWDKSLADAAAQARSIGITVGEPLGAVTRKANQKLFPYLEPVWKTSDPRVLVTLNAGRIERIYRLRDAMNTRNFPWKSEGPGAPPIFFEPWEMFASGLKTLFADAPEGSTLEKLGMELPALYGDYLRNSVLRGMAQDALTGRVAGQDQAVVEAAAAIRAFGETAGKPARLRIESLRKVDALAKQLRSLRRSMPQDQKAQLAEQLRVFEGELRAAGEAALKDGRVGTAVLLGRVATLVRERDLSWDALDTSSDPAVRAFAGLYARLAPRVRLTPGFDRTFYSLRRSLTGEHWVRLEVKDPAFLDALAPDMPMATLTGNVSDTLAEKVSLRTALSRYRPPGKVQTPEYKRWSADNQKATDELAAAQQALRDAEAMPRGLIFVDKFVAQGHAIEKLGTGEVIVKPELQTTTSTRGDSTEAARENAIMEAKKRIDAAERAYSNSISGAPQTVESSHPIQTWTYEEKRQSWVGVVTRVVTVKGAGLDLSVTQTAAPTEDSYLRVEPDHAHGVFGSNAWRTKESVRAEALEKLDWELATKIVAKMRAERERRFAEYMAKVGGAWSAEDRAFELATLRILVGLGAQEPLGAPISELAAFIVFHDAR